MPKKTASWSKKFLKTLLLLSVINILSTQTFAGTDPPITYLEKEPDTPDGKNGWYVKPVKITLTGEDLESGVKEINYKINDGNWIKKDFSNSLNLAPNPSFETSSLNPPLNTQDWEISNSNPGGSYSRDVLIYQPDFASTSVKIVSTENTWHSIDNYDMFAAASSFNNMSASVWMRTSNVSGNAYFNVYSISQDALGNKTTTLETTSGTLTGTSDWTKLSVNFTTTAENVIGVYLEIGTSGTGTIWIDAVSISKSNVPTTSFYVSNDGNHTIQYYAVDKAGNEETTQSESFKIDQTPPSNWGNAGAIRELSGDAGSEHRVYVYIEVTDQTSGISSLSDRFQYTTNHQNVTTFGYFSDLLACNSTWMEDGWLDPITLIIYPESGGKTGQLLTPKIDFCNSDWKICKWTRFYAEDNAGNWAIKDICINGPWIKIRGKGVVRANQNIDMVAEAPVDEYNTDGLIEIGGNSINFFSSSEDMYYGNIDAPTDYDYQKLFDITKGTKTQISVSDDLISSDGVYFIDGDYEIKSQKVPNDYDSIVFNQVVFVNGDLRISDDIEVSNVSTALFVVSGNVEVDKKVEDVGIGIFTDGILYSGYNLGEGETCKTLNMNGIFTAQRFAFYRTLLGQNNEKDPAESIVYEPKYVIKMGEYIGNNAIRWISSN